MPLSGDVFAGTCTGDTCLGAIGHWETFELLSFGNIPNRPGKAVIVLDLVLPGFLGDGTGDMNVRVAAVSILVVVPVLALVGGGRGGTQEHCCQRS